MTKVLDKDPIKAVPKSAEPMRKPAEYAVTVRPDSGYSRVGNITVHSTLYNSLAQTLHVDPESMRKNIKYSILYFCKVSTAVHSKDVAEAMADKANAVMAQFRPDIKIIFSAEKFND